MFSAAAPKCTKCKKTVGFAEAVYHNEHVYHRGCYRCNSCSKKLQRGQGLSHDGENYCHHCHAKLFGPNGFRPGVSRTEQTIARVKMQMQPPFAHVSVDLKKSGMIKAVNSIRKSLSGKAPTKLHQFDVAIFTGKTEKELEAYLKEGKVDTSKWEAGMVADLFEQLKQGKSELGLDTNGNALRVASVVKVLVYDEANDVMLFAPLNSAEDSVQSTHDKTKVTEAEVYDLAFGDLNQNAYPQVLEMMNFHLDHVPLPIHDFVYPGVYEELGFNNMAASGFETKTVKHGKVEIPGALVLESTFATLQETPAQAGARLLTGRFSMKHATPKIFSRTVHKKVKTHLSTRFTGLNSEYHIFYIFLKKNLIAPLQKSLPREKVTPIKLPSPTKTGMNTNWYVWLHRGHLKAAEIVSELETVYKSDPRVKTLVGDVNFKGELALAMGEVMLEELQALQFFDK